MEQSRLLIAIALSFLVFLLWSVAFGPKPTKQAVHQKQAQVEKSQTQKQETATQSEPKQVMEKSTQAKEESTAQAEAVPEQPAKPARKITINTPLYRMVISERGAAVVNMMLKKYKETVQKNSPLKELVPQNMKGGTVLVSLTGEESPAQGIYSVNQQTDEVNVQGKPAELRFIYQTKDHVRIEKRYRFSPNSYLVDLMVTVLNGSDKSLNGAMKIALRDDVQNDHNRYGFEGPTGLINNHLEQVKIKNIEKHNTLEGKTRWIAIERLYFMQSLLNKVPIDARMVLAHKDNIIRNQMVTPLGDIKPGDQRTFEYSLFMGPKSTSVLRAADNELARAINFGWLDFIAKPCLWFMNLIYRVIPNYGIAIIILTIISRLAFWPLAQKSYKSMNDMRRLQPLMKEIREKYKDDKTKINQETMALYRTYKINPLGGCLPMLIQLPVFFALYRMLYQAIELRHAPFVGWINDLSAPDRLFHFGFKIPFMEPPYGIPVLTLIMGVTMILQQKMTPAPGDPTQAKMMMLMPVVFTVIFINFPSGLVLYWLFSNLVSIAQQYYTQKKLA